MEFTNWRLYLNNWAILANTEKQEVMWSFGDIKEPKISQILDFIQALSKLGSEIFSESIGIIRLRYPRPHPTKAKEIMIVNLLDKYHFVISDPLVTTRLITKIEFSETSHIDIIDKMRSILAGSASVIYSQFYSQETTIEPEIVDELFNESIKAVTFNTDQVEVGNGKCSFSALTLEELLFFHTLLKNIFESFVFVNKEYTPWGVIHSTSGSQIYLDYNSTVDAALISAFSSVVVTYCRLLFGGDPERLVYGSHSISGMDFVTSNNYIFVANNPRKLLRFEKFIRKWKKVPIEVIKDLAEPMKLYFTELAVIEYREKLRRQKFHQIINNLTKMGIRRARAYKIPENK
ncbi:MAG: hypothetical protein ACTSPV_02955 [Candidatus Hodarchaeales archaeon]